MRPATLTRNRRQSRIYFASTPSAQTSATRLIVTTSLRFGRRSFAHWSYMFGPCGRRRELLIEPGSLRKQTPWKARTRQDNVFSLSAEGDREILIAGHTPNTLVNDLINCQDGAVCISQDHVFFSFVFFDAGSNAVWLLELHSRSANVRGYRPFQIVGFME